MSYGCNSGNFSSGCFGNSPLSPASAFGSSCLGNQVYGTDLQNPNTTQLGPSFYSSRPENSGEAIRWQTSGVVSRPGQASCYRSRASALCNPCQTSGSLGWGSSGFQASSCGSPSMGFGSSGFQSVGCGSNSFSSQNSRPGLYRPTYLSSGNCQSGSYQAGCGSGF